MRLQMICFCMRITSCCSEIISQNWVAVSDILDFSLGKFLGGAGGGVDMPRFASYVLLFCNDMFCSKMVCLCMEMICFCVQIISRCPEMTCSVRK